MGAVEGLVRDTCGDVELNTCLTDADVDRTCPIRVCQRRFLG